jgi:hypothetical protein
MNKALWTRQPLWEVFFSGHRLRHNPALQAGGVTPNAFSTGLVLRRAPVSVRLHRNLRVFWRRRPDPVGAERRQTEAHVVSCLRPGAGHDPGGHLSHRAGQVQHSAHQCGTGRGRDHRRWAVVGEANRAPLRSIPSACCQGPQSRPRSSSSVFDRAGTKRHTCTKDRQGE